MVEVGVYGNVFSRSWEDLKILATKHTWYYNLWELCHRLDVKLEVNEVKILANNIDAFQRLPSVSLLYCSINY